MPSSSSSATARAPRRPTHASRRSTNHSTMSTTSSVASDSSRGTSGAAAGHHGRGFTTRSDRGAGAGSRETSSLLQGGGRGNTSMSAGGAAGGNPMGPEEDEFHFYEFQLFAYRIIYVFQGVFLGLLGPSLSYFSTLALNNAGINSPVASYGSIFSAHGGAALVMSFVSELVLNVSIEMDLMKNLMVGLLLCSGTWYACLPSVAAASGSLGVNVYFIAKGFWTALLNISLNRCTLWIAGDTIEYGRSLVTSMNFAYGFGTVLGPVIACVLDKLHIDMSNAYYGLALAQLIPMGLIIMLPSPRPLYGRTQNQTIIGFEDPTRRVPTVPSPIVGGVFLHVKHLGGSANCNPDTYDPLNNFIILLVTIFSTILFGIQLGLSAFLFDYIGHVLTVATHPLPNEDIVVWCCLLMILFWSSLWLSYVFFSKYMFHAFNTFSIFYLSIVCMVSSFGILFGTETGFACFVITLALFGFALAPLFTLSIHCLTRVINELLIRRVSSLIVFGCGMGEIFIPVLMGFFMGNYSGKTYGSVAVSYIVFILSMCLVGVSSMLLMMVRKKLRELDHPLENLSSASKRGSSAYQRV